MGFGSSKNKGKTVETRQQPWQAQQPYLENLFSRADALYGRGPLEYFPGRTVAPQSQATLSALNTQEQRAQSPNSLTAQARDLNKRTLAGGFLSADSNPYLRDSVDRALDNVQARVNSVAGRGGGNNFGSSAHQEWLGKSLAAEALPIYAQSYKDERGKQLFAQQMAPSLDTADINQLANVGAIRDAYEQSLINADKQRHDFTQLSPWDALQRYGTAVQGNYGNVEQKPYFPSNPYFDALGLGLGALGGYRMGQEAGLWGKQGSVGGFGGSAPSGGYDYANADLWQPDYSAGYY